MCKNAGNKSCAKLDADTERKYFAAIAKAEQETAKLLSKILELNQQDRNAILRMKSMVLAVLILAASAAIGVIVILLLSLW